MKNNKHKRARIIALDTLLPPKPSSSNCYTGSFGAASRRLGTRSAHYDIGFGEASSPYSRITMRGQMPRVIIPVFENAPNFMIEQKTRSSDIRLLAMSFVAAFATFVFSYVYIMF